jgi:hypothetical protein
MLFHRKADGCLAAGRQLYDATDTFLEFKLADDQMRDREARASQVPLKALTRVFGRSLQSD